MIMKNQCVLCGKEIDQQRATKQYCSATCRNKLYYQRRAELDIEHKLEALQDRHLSASAELDQLKQDNERLKQENVLLKRAVDELHEEKSSLMRLCTQLNLQNIENFTVFEIKTIKVGRSGSKSEYEWEMDLDNSKFYITYFYGYDDKGNKYMRIIQDSNRPLANVKFSVRGSSKRHKQVADTQLLNDLSTIEHE